MNDPLEAERRLRIDFVFAGDGWRVFADEPRQILAQLLDAGADTFVAGSAVYNTQDPKQAIDNLRALAQTATDNSWWCNH